MLIEVIFTDGSHGRIRTSRVIEFVKKGEIAAFKPLEKWVELRRKRKDAFMGPDRRVNTRL